MKPPAVVKRWTRALFVSITSTRPCESTAMPVGEANWPGPDPAEPHDAARAGDATARAASTRQAGAGRERMLVLPRTAGAGSAPVRSGARSLALAVLCYN